MLKLMDGVLLVSIINNFDALIINTKMCYSNISLLLILLFARMILYYLLCITLFVIFTYSLIIW